MDQRRSDLLPAVPLIEQGRAHHGAPQLYLPVTTSAFSPSKGGHSE